MMEEYITPESIANRIMQDHSFKGYSLIVEGIKDYTFYTKFIHDKNISFQIAFGCSNVLDVFQILSQRGFSEKIAIIDSDFRRITENNIREEGIFQTDDHDIEVMILKTIALYDVVKNYCTKNKIEQFETINQESIRDCLLRIGQNIGILKLANKIHQLGLIFKPRHSKEHVLSYKQFLNISSGLNLISTEKMVDVVINYSKGKSPKIATKETILAKFEDVAKMDFKDIYQLVNGHDLTNILFLLIKKVLQTKKTLMDYNSIEDNMALAYDSKDFMSTQLYKDMAQWSEKHNVNIFNDRCHN